jgi:Predicted helicase
MAKRISRTQLNSAINKYNQAVRKYNSAVKKQVSDYNRTVNQHNQQVKRNIDNYNREVRRFNAEQERRRQKLNQAIRTFNNTKYTVRTTTTITHRESVERLQRSYTDLDRFNQDNSYYADVNPKLFEDYPTQETDNSIQLYNSLSGNDTGDYIDPQELQQSYVIQKLDIISTDLSNRWKGALFSLNPNNPDASRHFCTSVREVFTQVIDLKAPDYSVVNYFSDCEMYQGKPNRRFKIKYILSQKSIESEQLEKFVDSDIEDLLSLFRTLNDGTHGSAGKFTIQQLLKLKKRVEDSINFIADL